MNLQSFFQALRGLFTIAPARAATLTTASAAIIYSGFALNERSLITLAPTSPRIQAVTKCAATKPIFTDDGKKISFVAYHGFRTDEEHRSMLAKGVSWVNRSKHQDGKAIDVMARIHTVNLQTGKETVVGTWEHQPYYKIATAFYKCSGELNIPITWGGEWRVKDMVHFEEKQ